MAHCVICNKDFANSASLRTHRSKFHRNKMSNSSPKDIESQDTLNEEIHDSVDESEEDSRLSKLRHNKDTTDEDSQDTLDEESKKDDMSGKRKHSETEDTDNEEEDYPYLRKKKDRHMYKSFRVSTIF